MGIDLTYSLGKGEDERSMRVYFMVISCESVSNCIIGRPFLATLDVVTSSIHLKMKYHISGDKTIIIFVDMCSARRIHEAILRRLTTTLRPMLDGEFEVIQLNGNHFWSVKIGDDLLVKVRERLIRCQR